MITRRSILAAGMLGAGLVVAEQLAAQEGAPRRDNVGDALTTDATRETMQITRAGSQPSTKGSPTYFTGSVRIDSPFRGTAAARISGATVTFDPGARTAWHTHPLGQTLLVTSGVGWVQREGAAKEEIRPGDIVWIPPGVKHWHGASATTAMTHIAISEALEGKTVDWLEQVSDAEYSK